MFVGDTNYIRDAPPPNNAPAIPGLFLRGGGTLALVDPGGPAPAHCCDTLLNRDMWPTFPTDTPSTRDLLVFVPVDAETPLTQLDIRVAGQSGLKVAVAEALTQPLRHLEKYAYPAGTGPSGTDGHHIDTGWALRLPIVLTPTAPWDIGGVRYPIDVALTYRVSGDPQPHALAMRGAIEAQVASAIYEMSAVGAVLPLLCLVAAFRRWRNTR